MEVMPKGLSEVREAIKRAEKLDCCAYRRYHMPGNALPDYVPPKATEVCAHCKMLETLRKLEKDLEQGRA